MTESALGESIFNSGKKFSPLGSNSTTRRQANDHLLNTDVVETPSICYE